MGSSCLEVACSAEARVSTDEVLSLLDQPLEGAALGAALELGLFWSDGDSTESVRT
jgi:hypothetical protein